MFPFTGKKHSNTCAFTFKSIRIHFLVHVAPPLLERYGKMARNMLCQSFMHI